jgi:hypothetical protein
MNRAKPQGGHHPTTGPFAARFGARFRRHRRMVSTLPGQIVAVFMTGKYGIIPEVTERYSCVSVRSLQILD